MVYNLSNTNSASITYSFSDKKFIIGISLLSMNKQLSYSRINGFFCHPLSYSDAVTDKQINKNNPKIYLQYAIQLKSLIMLVCHTKKV